MSKLMVLPLKNLSLNWMLAHRLNLSIFIFWVLLPLQSARAGVLRKIEFTQTFIVLK